MSSTILNGWQTNIKSLNHIGKIQLYSYREIHTDANLWTKWEHETVCVPIPGVSKSSLWWSTTRWIFCNTGKTTLSPGIPKCFLPDRTLALDDWILAPLKNHRCIPTSKPAVIVCQWFHLDGYMYSVLKLMSIVIIEVVSVRRRRKSALSAHSLKSPAWVKPASWSGQGEREEWEV